jgi:anti-sigma-K factor RskA
MDSTRDDERSELEPPVLQGLGQAVPQIEPSRQLRERVLRSVETRSIATPAASERARASWLWLAVAASLALVVAMTMYTGQLRRRIATLENDLREAQRLADANAGQIADAERDAAGAQAAVAILSAPDVARVDLAGQAVAPQSSARAFWSRSRGMVFTASNLPQLPAGRIYQLWVLTADATPMSAGLLSPDPQGRVNQMFLTPPNLPQPVAMAVTIEPEGGVPAPTGEKYLVGTL